MPHPPRDRSVSPVGASRFEKPYVPPPPSSFLPRSRGPHSSTTSSKDSKDTSPTSPTASSMTGPASHFSHPSTATTRTGTTASSLHTPRTPVHDTHHSTDFGHTHLVDSPTCSLPPSTPDDPQDADSWFARFRSDPDLSLTYSDECPDRATLAAVYDLPVYAADNTSRPFGSLYDPAYALHPRQLVLFVRHFYCGACQAYLQCLARAITKEDYFAIPIPTSIIVVGCGKPDLIPQYKKFTGCPFPIFADPSRTLFKKLGMVVSMNIGRERPEYMRDISAPAWLAGQVTTIRKSLRDPEGIRKRDIVRGGNPMQIGGEFLFEDGEVVWCHRMRNYRNHAEVAVLRKLLELDE